MTFSALACGLQYETRRVSTNRRRARMASRKGVPTAICTSRLGMPLTHSAPPCFVSNMSQFGILKRKIPEYGFFFGSGQKVLSLTQVQFTRYFVPLNQFCKGNLPTCVQKKFSRRKKQIYMSESLIQSYLWNRWLPGITTQVHFLVFVILEFPN